MFTVAPDCSKRLKFLPAGTVKELMFTVAHLTASETSSREEIVPVQAVVAAVVRAGAAASARTMAVRRSNITVLSMSVESGLVSNTATHGAYIRTHICFDRDAAPHGPVVLW